MKSAIMAVTKSAYATFQAPPCSSPWSTITLRTMIIGEWGDFDFALTLWLPWRERRPVACGRPYPFPGKWGGHDAGWLGVPPPELTKATLLSCRPANPDASTENNHFPNQSAS